MVDYFINQNSFLYLCHQISLGPLVVVVVWQMVIKKI